MIAGIKNEGKLSHPFGDSANAVFIPVVQRRLAVRIDATLVLINALRNRTHRRNYRVDFTAWNMRWRGPAVSNSFAGVVDT